jgi:spore coat protein A, manganese oxidase
MDMISRRKFLKAAALLGASVIVPGSLATVQPVQAGLLAKRQAALSRMLPAGEKPQNSFPTLDPYTIPKYTTPLVIPPPMPRTSKVQQRAAKNIDYYEISVRQFEQQILPAGFPLTTVWSYGSVNHPNSYNYPSFTIEAKWNKPVRVKWINELVDENGDYLPHLLPVDPTLHWANPPGGEMHRDHEPMFEETPGPYTGPVPIVTHVHGAHTYDFSDGYAEAWYLPNARNIDPSYAKTGTFYDYFKPIAENKLGQTWEPGSSVFQYPNDQNAATLWYHDHTLGMTRLNVYAGPAGFYLIRGGPTDLKHTILPAGKYEIPLAIQDRSFNEDGSLFFPDSREFFDGIAGPYIPETDVAPIWNPEFFGDTMVVNGNTWPVLSVEPRRYRFRMLNGCNSRFLILQLSTSTDPEAPAALPFWQIGAEGGFMPAPEMMANILLSPAERADVVVDFSMLPVGTEIFMLNLAPDEPFGGGEPGVDFDYADMMTTGQVMKFVVVPLKGKDRSVPPAQLVLPAAAPLPAPTATRQLSLNEMMSMHEEFDGPTMALLGLIDSDGNGVPLKWSDPISENPDLGATEVWEIFNFTADAHPIHLHQVMFEVVNRETFDGIVRPPEPNETGPKDTVIALPDEITRIKAKFDLPGLFVWHCHIVDHEDNEMMRPYFVGPKPPNLPAP